MNKIRLLVVDDHPVFRFGIVSMFHDLPDIEVIAEAADGVEGVEAFRHHRPDVCLMDLRLPRLSGVEAILEIRREFPDARVIVLTTYDSDEDIFRGIQSGAKSYLLKDSPRDQILATVRGVHAGQNMIPRSVADALSHRLERDELTGRELEVLQLLVRGRSNKEISSDLNITERTVKFHLTSLFGKLKVLDRTQAAITAVRLGIVHPD